MVTKRVDVLGILEFPRNSLLENTRISLNRLRRCNQRVVGVTFLITVYEEFRAYRSCLIDQKCSGVRKTSLVMNSVCFDRFAPLIGEQQKPGRTLFRIPLEYLDGIKADAHHLNPRGLDFLQIRLQLTQLLFAVRSPVCGTIKDQGDAALFEEIFESLLFSILIFQREGRSFLADFDTRPIGDFRFLCLGGLW